MKLLSDEYHVTIIVKSTLVQVMAWCRQASSHYLNQCWSRSLSPNDIITRPQCVNTLRPRQNGRHFADDIFKCIFLNENVWIPIKISLKFVPQGPINKIPALVQIMAWRRPSDKPLSEAMMVNLLTHICVTRPQWVKTLINNYCDHVHTFYLYFRKSSSCLFISAN